MVHMRGCNSSGKRVPDPMLIMMCVMLNFVQRSVDPSAIGSNKRRNKNKTYSVIAWMEKRETEKKETKLKLSKRKYALSRFCYYQSMTTNGSKLKESE